MRYFLENNQIKVEIDSNGAEVKSVIGKKENREYMWYGNPKYWGRTSPVLFPFVGSLKDAKFIFEDTEYPMGQHGFARDMEHTIVYADDSEIRFRLTDSEMSRSKYPFRFIFETVYTLRENQLEVTWEVANPASESNLYFSVGAHPAFLCPIHGESTKTGYKLRFDGCSEIHHYGNKTVGGLAVEEDRILPLENETAVISEDFFDDTTYIISGDQVNRISIEDPDGRAYISVSFDTPLVGIWSPEGKNAPFVCIEPWYGRCDSFDFNGSIEQRKHQQELAPGGIFRGGYTISFN